MALSAPSRATGTRQDLRLRLAPAASGRNGRRGQFVVPGFKIEFPGGVFARPRDGPIDSGGNRDGTPHISADGLTRPDWDSARAGGGSRTAAERSRAVRGRNRI